MENKDKIFELIVVISRMEFKIGKIRAKNKEKAKEKGLEKVLDIFPGSLNCEDSFYYIRDIGTSEISTFKIRGTNPTEALRSWKEFIEKQYKEV